MTGSLPVVPRGRYVQALLSLVELLHYCALIGRELHSDEIFPEQSLDISPSLMVFGAGHPELPTSLQQNVGAEEIGVLFMERKHAASRAQVHRRYIHTN